MIDPRIYRAALIPVLFAFVLLACSLENRPQPLRTVLPPDAFQGKRAFDRAYGDGGGVRGLSERFPDRRPGSAGDNRLATRIAREMGRAPVGRLHDVVAVLAQRIGQQRLDCVLVIDEKDARSTIHHPQ